MISWSEAAVHVDDIQEQLQRSVELAPEFVKAWSQLAWVRSESGIYPDRALEAVERTEALAPGTLPAIKARGWYQQYVEEDFEGALELMREAERLAPSDSEVLIGLARLQHRLGAFSEGTRTMKRAVQLDPKNTETLVHLSNMLMRQSRWQAAREVLERVLAIDPSHFWAQYQLVHLTIQGDRNPDAALGLAAEFGLEPRYLHAWIATTDRDYDRAARILASVPVNAGNPFARDLRRDNLSASVWVEEMRGGDPEPLRDSLAVVLSSDPIQTDPWNLLREAEARIQVGRVTGGWALWDEVVAEIRVWNDQAGSNSARWVAARIAAQFGRPEQAVALLDEAVGKPADGIWSVPDLTLDPQYDAIRDDPRFDALIARQQAYEDEQAREAERDGPWLP
jgi:tetratricopeptide (TPR) repeat protein